MNYTRDQWPRRSAFVLAAIGSAIGLGNVWRFPYIAQKGGGGAFLIPYFVALLTAGIPLLVLEMGLGQYLKGAAPQVFGRIRKGFELFGWWAAALSAGIVIYYSTLLAWAFNYLRFSLNLAWGDDAETFFNQDFLHKTSGPGELGGFSIPIAVGLILTWACVYWILRKGLARVSKVVMWTVPLPILCLVILFVRGITLPGAIDGIAYYLTPDFSKILDYEIWMMAYGQVFFSLSLASGVMIAYGSFQAKKPEVTNNAFITALANCGTSFFAGFAVFSTLGYLAVTTGVPVDEVSASGTGLAFMVYPTAISKLPALNALFALIFFAMLLTLGIDSAFALQEAFTTGICDKWRLSKDRVNLVFCVVACLVSLVYATYGGYYWFDITDQWIAAFGLVIAGLLHCILVGWFLDMRKFKDHINGISEIRLGSWWIFMVRFLTPVVLVVILYFNIRDEIREPYGGYPAWATLLGGWCVLLGLAVVAWFLYRRKAPSEGGES